jgi:hypothetical protein
VGRELDVRNGSGADNISFGLNSGQTIFYILLFHMTGMIRSNVTEAPLKWTVRAIAREFKLAENTVSRKLSESKQSPDSKGVYATSQVTAALYGDLSAERLRELKGRADNWELKNRALIGELLDREELEKTLGQLFVSFKSAIESTSMTREEKTATLEVLASWPVVVKETAAQQSKQLHLRPEKEPLNGDGEAAEERDSPPEPHTIPGTS